MIQVVCGIIYKDDNIFIARRNQDKHLGGKWEFPGGKIKKGETEKMALERELMEEFGMSISVGDRIGSVEHHYPEISINLIAYHGRYVNATFNLIDHDNYQWVNSKQFRDFELSEADQKLIAQLKL